MIARTLRAPVLLLVGLACMVYEALRPHRSQTVFRCQSCQRTVHGPFTYRMHPILGCYRVEHERKTEDGGTYPCGPVWRRAA